MSLKSVDGTFNWGYVIVNKTISLTYIPEDQLHGNVGTKDAVDCKYKFEKHAENYF